MTLLRIKKFDVKRKILEAFPIVVNLAPSNVWLEGARFAPESPSIIQDGHGDIGDEEDVLEDDKDQPDMKELNKLIRKEISQLLINCFVKC